VAVGGSLVGAFKSFKKLSKALKEALRKSLI
jgi:hypothetical protein